MEDVNFTLISFPVLAPLRGKKSEPSVKRLQGSFFWHTDVISFAEVRYIRICSFVIKSRFFLSVSKTQVSFQQNQAAFSNNATSFLN